MWAHRMLLYTAGIEVGEGSIFTVHQPPSQGPSQNTTRGRDGEGVREDKYSKYLRSGFEG